MSSFPKTLLNIAAEVEAAELSIKHQILAAAEAGDLARVKAIVSRWLDAPPAQVILDIGLASCGPSEVLNVESPGGGGEAGAQA